MWGIVPAAGHGSRIQPLAFSKELLPVGSRVLDDVRRPCAVAEYLVERLIRGGADKICFVIGEGKSDILDYFGSEFGGVMMHTTQISQIPCHEDDDGDDDCDDDHDHDHDHGGHDDDCDDDEPAAPPSPSPDDRAP